MSLVKEVEKLHPEERRKITELIKAKEDKTGGNSGSKPDASTSWMYEQPKRSGEDFLLGKAIQSLEELADINRDQEEETPTQRLTRLDMEAKFREDPLNLMRQHEMDKRSALLQNTARMKKLQKLIEMQNAAKEGAEKRKEKKRLKKEHKKRKRRISESSSSSSSSSDDEILEKFINIIKKVDQVKNDGKCGFSVSEKSESEKNDKKKKKKKHKHNHHHSHHLSKKDKKSSDSPKISEDSRLKIIPEAPSQDSREDSHLHRRSKSVSPKKTSDRPSSRRHDDRDRYRRRSPRSPPRRDRSPARRRRSRSRSQDLGGNRRKKPTQEEMAALREQMAADAKEREAERVKRFEQHQNEKAKEENEEGQARVSHGASFLRGMTLKHVSSTSVEEVVQRNANKRQRGGMDQNFLRR